MKISKKSQYGLRALVQLAKSYKTKKVLSIKAISKKENIPPDFLEKIILQLEKAGLVKAKRGVSGGYFLARSPKKITPADIVAVLEEDLAVVHCSGCPMAQGCSSQQVWSEVQESLDKSLSSTTLADLIK